MHEKNTPTHRSFSQRYGSTDSKCSSMDISEKDFDWAFGLNRLALKFLGLWPYGNSSKGLLIVPALIIYSFFSTIIPMAYAVYKVRLQLPLIVDNLRGSITGVLACVKLYLLWSNRDTIEPLVTQLREDWHQDKPISYSKMMQLQANRARKLAIIGTPLTFILATCFFLLPTTNFSLRILNNITDPHPERNFPFQTYYPFDVYQSPIYELTYLVQIFGAYTTAVAFTLPENIFAAFVFHACSQCQIIEDKLRKLAGDNFSINFGKYIFTYHLRNIVIRQAQLIRFVGNIENLFGYLILAHFLFLTLIIGCVGFSTIDAFHSKNFTILATFSTTMLDMMLYTLIYCAAGELLTSYSFRILNAIYQPNLQSLPSDCARDLIIVMIRLQNPLKITGGKYLSLTLNTYLQLVKKIAGYISMLLTLNQ